MDTVFEEVVKQVIAYYPLNPEAIHLLSYKGKKSVWSIRTGTGEFIMKKVPSDENHIAFMIHAIDYLRTNGVLTPGIIKTKLGNGYVKHEGEYYVVFESVRGRSPEYEKVEELLMILRGMALFHRASKGIEPPCGTFPSFLLTEWKSDLKRRYDRLSDWKEQRTHIHDKNDFDRIFLAHVDTFLNQCMIAMDMLEHSCFEQWKEESVKIKTLCHQDFAAGNLVIGNDGQLYVYDMDSLTVDLPVRDMRKILNKVMKQWMRWDLSLMKTMLKAYQEVNPMTKEQYLVLASDIMFPHLFYGQISKYYEHRDKEWTLQKHIYRLNDMIATETSKESIIAQFLNDLDEVIEHG